MKKAFVAVALVLSGLAFAPSAFAAGVAHHSFVNRPPVPPATAAPSSVAPISNSYTEFTSGLTGQIKSAFGKTSQVTSLGLNDIQLLQSTPNGLGAIAAISLPKGQAFKAGTVYSTQPGFSLMLSIPDTTGTNTNCTGTPASPPIVEVDQLTQDVSGNVTSLAIQFFCTDSQGDGFFEAASLNVTPSTPGRGYYTVQSNGLIISFGNDSYLTYLGDLSVQNFPSPFVGMAITPDGGGYWMVEADGGVVGLGDAKPLGQVARPGTRVVGIAATPDGHGYWIATADGNVFNFGDALPHGSAGNIRLNKPIVGMAATPDGKGYWLVASDGGIFNYGDARFHGSAGGIRLNKPIVGMAATPDGGGYWLVASDGGIFTYGDARFHGSAGDLPLVQPIVGMAVAPGGQGYWLVAADGGIFSFHAPFFGSFGGLGVTDVVGLVP